MRRVILINPRMSEPRSVRLPLSLLHLGAALEGNYDFSIVDGNLQPDLVSAVLSRLSDGDCALVGVTVMPGPQVAPAIEISAAVRAADPGVSIAWGGYFPTLYPDSAINAPYVDYLIRGQGEDTLLELLERLPDAGPPDPESAASARDGGALRDVRGLTWKDGRRIVHNPERPFRPPDDFPPLPYHRLDDLETYMRPSFLGSRTGVHQAALGCRFRCRFCGVVSMFDGITRLPGARRLESALELLRGCCRPDAMQFYDHNFFDRESSSVAALEVLARFAMPWWCYARADALAGFSERTWELIRRSRLAMAYIGAETASDEALRRMKKGGRVQHTVETARLCRSYGVIPEFSFVLGGPEDPEGEIDKTFQFIRRLKKINPASEIFLYFYSPTPQRDPSWKRLDREARPRPVLETYGPGGPRLPTTPEEWTDRRWVDYVCHQDAPWLTPRTRRKVRDFARVLYCRFPTVQDTATPLWARNLLRTMASWRWTTGAYGRSWELALTKRFIRIRDPVREGL